MRKTFKPNGGLLSDSYKFSHKAMLPPNTTRLVANFTPRSIKYAPEAMNRIVVFGIQYTLQWVTEYFNEHFFDNPNAVTEMKTVLDSHFGIDYDVSHFQQLHGLGYMPIKFKSLPEGTKVKEGVPVLVWENTHDDFAWLCLWLETIISATLWKPMVNASLSHTIRDLYNTWADKTSTNREHVAFQGHDFSMRGLAGLDAVCSSGMAHLTAFKGTDSVPALQAAQHYYDAELNTLGFSVPASEHSVSSACISVMGEQDMISYYMKQFPTGILSIVSDTFDLWKVLTEYLPNIKEDILNRDGKIVIRPDSGDPVDIVCGTRNAKDSEAVYNGVVQILWDVFGGTVNEKGYKVLDPHVGCIYGDAITYDVAEHMFERLAANGFSSENIVFGQGSFYYQLNTRDTIGGAAKGTYVVVDGKGVPIYKDPITKGSINKKSAKGLVRVEIEDGEYVLLDEQTEYQFECGELRVVLKDGVFEGRVTFEEIRSRLSDYKK